MVESGVIHKEILLEHLVVHEANYKKHPQKQIAKLMKSLQRFKQVRSIVVSQIKDTEKYSIIAGHGIVEAARQLFRIDPVLYAHLRMFSCNVVPQSWSAQDIRAYLVADNESDRDAEVDDIQLATLLEEQRNLGHDLETMGFTDAEFNEYLERLGDAVIEEEEEAFEDDELAPISDEVSGGEAIDYLKFGKNRIPLTEQELQELEQALKEYKEETGSYYGFARSLMHV